MNYTTIICMTINAIVLIGLIYNHRQLKELRHMRERHNLIHKYRMRTRDLEIRMLREIVKELLKMLKEKSNDKIYNGNDSQSK